MQWHPTNDVNHVVYIICITWKPLVDECHSVYTVAWRYMLQSPITFILILLNPLDGWVKKIESNFLATLGQQDP